MSTRALAGCTLITCALVTCAAPDTTVTVGGADIVLAAAGASNPTVAVGPDGDRAFAAWVGTVDGISNVYVGELTGDHSAHIDARRGPAVRVNDRDGDAAPHDQAPPQVAVAPNGDVLVVWQNNIDIPGRRFPASNLLFARSRDGGRSFEPAVFVNDDAHGEPATHTFHDIAVARDGTVYIAWIDGRSQSGSDVRVARSTDGGSTFPAGTVVQRDICPCCRISIAVSPDGNVAVAYRTSTDDIRDIAIALSTDGGKTFGAPNVVHEDGWRIAGCPHAGASLAFGPDGRLHVAWYTGHEDRQGLWYSVSAADLSAFSEPQPLLVGGWVPVSQVKLDVDESGNVWIAWDDRREPVPAVRLTRVDGKSGALRPVAMSSDSIPSGSISSGSMSSGSVSSSRPAANAIVGASPAIAAGRSIVVAWLADSIAAARVLRPR